MASKLRPIVKMHGGKYYISKFIISHFPEHHIFVDCCGGGASILLNKEPSKVEVYNDLDKNLVNIVEEIVHNTDHFLKQVNALPYTLETFEWAKKTDSPLAELVLRRFSRGGLRKDFAWSERLRGGKPGDVNAWETYKKHLVDIAIRLKDVKIYNLDVLEIIKKFDATATLFYIDPTYLPETRTVPKAYTIEMSKEQHEELGKALQTVKGKVVLSGYWSELYDELYKGWHMTHCSVANHSGQGKVKQRRVECLWRNF